MTTNSILITGGTGFLGSALVGRLMGQGYSVHVMSRSAEKVARQFGKEVRAVTSMGQLPDAGEFKAVINLAGAGIFDRRWNAERKQMLRDSRIQLTEELADWLLRSKQPATVFVSGSAVGIYGDQGDELLGEDSQCKADFSQQLCVDWETAALKAQGFTRVCIIRTGLVLGQGGGLLQRMLPPFSLGFGGAMGDGRQWMSWIHIQDWLTIVESMISNTDMRGAYNATAPHPATNRQFSEMLARILGRPLLLPLSGSLLKVVLGEMAELVLGSQRALPKRLLADGFQFQYPELEPALRNVLNKNS